MISLTQGTDLYNSGLSAEHIATILPMPAALADSIPDNASSTTIQSSGLRFKFFAAI